MKNLILAFAIIIASPAHAQNYPDFKGSFVIDQADIIPEKEETVLNQKLIDYKSKTLNEVAVVTVTSLEGEDIKTYANTYFRKLGIGNKDANNGVMLLIAPNDRKVRIEIGYGLEPWFTDFKSSKIIEDIILPDFKAGNMAQGVIKGANAVLIAATPPTAEEKAAAKAIAREETLRAQQARDNFFEFLLTLLGFITAAGSMFGVYWLATAKRRAKARAEKEAKDAILRAEIAERLQKESEIRMQAAARQRAKDQKIAARSLKIRTDMLNSMSVSERQTFLQREAEDQRLAQIREEQAQAALRAKRERERKEDEDRERKRRQASSSTYSSSSYGSSNSSSNDSSSSFSGGSSGGGGSDSSW